MHNTLHAEIAKFGGFGKITKPRLSMALENSFLPEDIFGQERRSQEYPDEEMEEETDEEGEEGEPEY